MRFYKSDDQTPLKVPASETNIINTYGSANGDHNRFAEQLGAFLSEGDRLVPNRAEIVQNPKLLTMSDSERQLDDLKLKSRRQAIEGTILTSVNFGRIIEIKKKRLSNLLLIINR